ncbi:winged helix-turn-helix domain-containing protein, partial [Actinospica durhamensis]
MIFRLLGQVDVWARERGHTVGPLKSQALLAALLLESGRVVSVQTLAERVWDEQMPVRTRETIHVYICRLRKRLQAAGDELGVITNSESGGYRLDVDAEHVDVRRFNQLVSRARAASTGRDPHRARELLRQAESLWRGEPLEGLTGQWAQSVRHGLLERRRAALLARINLDLQIEADREGVISELTDYTLTGRIDQGAIEMLMTALADAGREDEALEVYRAARIRLREELGVDPRRELLSLHQTILRGELTSERPSAAPGRRGVLAPNTLDRDPPYLIGRDGVLGEITSAAAEELARLAGIALIAIDGMPGIGKTSLALRAAHQLAPQCPDGALQLDFRTHDPRQPPLDLRTAVVLLLGALGASTRDLMRADSADELVALWRRRTSGMRLLIFFDDVDDADQIAGLMPVTPGSVILLTSRRRLPLPSSRQLTVASMNGLAAVRLLMRVTGRRFPQQSQELRRFAAYCGGLPLAVAVAAAHLRAHPTWSLADLVERLENQVSIPWPDQLSAPVHRAFELSYQMLAPATRSVLRLVASQPTPDIGVYAVAALVGEEPGAVDLLLETLVEHHLLEEVSRHRYRLHDLLRAFAARRAVQEDDEAELSAAIDRMICFYLATAARAERIARPHRRIAVTIPDSPLEAEPRFEQAAVADAWLESEIANLLMIAAHTDTAATPDGYAGLVACVVAPYLDRQGLWPRAIEVLTRALAAVAVDQDDHADPEFAQLHHYLGSAYLRVNRLEEGAACMAIALESWRVQRVRRNEADALHELGRIELYANQLENAGASFEASEALYREVGHARGRVYADYHRAIVLFEQNRHGEAFAVAHRALELVEQLEDASLACDVLINLAEMYRWIGRDEPARRYLDEAEHHVREHRSPQHLAAIALNAGILSHRAGDNAAAAVSLRTALKFYETLGDRGCRIDALTALAAVHGAGDLDAAQACVGGAQDLLEEMRDAQRAARLEVVVAQLLIRAGQDVESCVHLRTAIEYAQQADAPLEEIQARAALGTTLMALGDEQGARREQRRVRSLQHRLGGG